MMSAHPSSSGSPPTQGDKRTPADLAELWRRAVNDYNDKVGKDGDKLRIVGGSLLLVTSLEQVTAEVHESSKAFRKWRHSGSGIDKVRTFIGENLGYVLTIGDKLADSAAAAFPPAGVIWTVATYAIKACEATKGDYDQLLALIGEAGNFLRSLQIIEDNVPNCKQYTECVTDALTALVSVFAIQTRFIRDGRALQFWHSLSGKGDPELDKAYSDVAAAITRLSTANEMMAVRNTEELKKLVSTYGGKLDTYYEATIVHLEEQRLITEAGFGRQAVKLEVGFAQQQEQGAALEKVMMQGFQELREQLAREAHGKLETITELPTDAASRGTTALRKARIFFGNPVDQTRHLQQLEQMSIPEIASWVFEDETYKSWLDGKGSAVLWLTGEPGVGKSHVAYSVIKSLQETVKSQPRTYVAYFFFQESNDEFRSGNAALSCAGLQIAIQNQAVRESIASTFSDEEDSCIGKTVFYVWNNVFSKFFEAASDAQLYLVLDGFDEMNDGEMMEFLALFRQIPFDGLRIRLFLTGRRRYGIDVFEEDVSPLVLESSLEKSRNGLQSLLDARFTQLPRLSKFSYRVRHQISQTLIERGYGPLFVDRFLKTLDSKGLERSALKAIEPARLPPDLTSLYDEVLLKCNDKRTQEESEALKLVFLWMAFAKRQLTLEELNCLIRQKFGAAVLDIEEEIAGKCASIIDISSNVPVVQENKGELADEKARLNSSARQKDGEWLTPDKLPDSALVVTFQERTLTEHIGDARVPGAGLRAPQYFGAVELFITLVEVLCSNHEKQPNLKALENYAATFWLRHFIELGEIEDSALEQGYPPFTPTEGQVINVVEALCRITSNDNEASLLIMEHFPGCYDIFDHSCVQLMKRWSQKGLDCGSGKLSERATDWARATIADPRRVLQPLAKGHVADWYGRTLEEPIYAAFKVAWKAFQTQNCKGVVGSFQDESDLVPEKELAEPVHNHDDDEWEDEDDEDDDDSGIPDPVTEDDVSSVVDAFPELERGCSAHRAIGVVLATLGHYETAKKALDKSLEQSDCDDERFVTLVTLGMSCLDLQESDAQQYITQALSLPNRPTITDDGRQLIQLALLTRAEWEAEHQMYAQAYEKVEEAMTVWPGKSSECFAYLICLLGFLDEHNKILQKVEQWNPMRLAFTGDDSLTVNEFFQRAAKLSGNEVVITKTYELLIKHLDPLNMAAGTQYHFALACRRILRDVEKAKALLYQILDSEVCIDPATDTVSDSIPFLALNELAEIIFEQFYAASSVGGKTKFLQEMEGVPKRRLGNANADESQCNPYPVILARMYRKVGPVDKFYNTLHPVFLSCVSSLQDDNPWNDAATLRQLCNVLFCLRGLEDDAQLAYSAQFYVLSRTVMRKNKKLIRHLQRTADGVMVLPAAADEDSDEDEAHESDGGTEQDYDVADIAGIRCGGVCQANTPMESEITNWETPLYRCVICANTDLCESCYLALGESPPPGDDGGMWRKYCGLRHEYVRGPAAGWKGIKDGKIIIEGRDQLLFAQWLQDLKDVKWPQAWERFCEGY